MTAEVRQGGGHAHLDQDPHRSPLCRRALLALAVPVASASPPPAPAQLEWSVTTVDADQSFRGLDAVDRFADLPHH